MSGLVGQTSTASSPSSSSSKLIVICRCDPPWELLLHSAAPGKQCVPSGSTLQFLSLGPVKGTDWLYATAAAPSASRRPMVCFGRGWSPPGKQPAKRPFCGEREITTLLFHRTYAREFAQPTHVLVREALMPSLRPAYTPFERRVVTTLVRCVCLCQRSGETALKLLGALLLARGLRVRSALDTGPVHTRTAEPTGEKGKYCANRFFSQNLSSSFV